MAVPERRGLEQTSIEAPPSRAEVAPGGFNWQALGGEEIPAALMISPAAASCVLRSIWFGGVATNETALNGRGQETDASRGLQFGLEMGRASEKRAFVG